MGKSLEIVSYSQGWLLDLSWRSAFKGDSSQNRALTASWTVWVQQSCRSCVLRHIQRRCGALRRTGCLYWLGHTGKRTDGWVTKAMESDWLGFKTCFYESWAFAKRSLGTCLLNCYGSKICLLGCENKVRLLICGKWWLYVTQLHVLVLCTIEHLAKRISKVLPTSEILDCNYVK